MDISSLIDRPDNGGGPAPPVPSSSSATSSPMIQSRRQTVSSLLNDDDDDESPLQTRRSSIAISPKSPTNTKRKPRKYETPPIWAQEWRGKSALNNMNKPIDVAKSGPRENGTNGNGNGGPVSVSGLPMSITGFQPFEDLSRKIVEWLYSHMFQMKEDRQYMEVEIKMGTICSKANDRRLDLPVVTETILRPDYVRQNTFFQSKMQDEMFNRAMSYLDRLCGGKAGSLTKTSSKTRDVMFASKNSANKLRVTYNEQNQPIERMVKKRVSDMMIYSPGDFLDLRISINLELPPSRIDAISESGQPTMVRNKNRTSYQHDGMQFDVTAVISDNSAKASKEIEIELDRQMLCSFFDDYNNDIDKKGMEKFEELVRLSVDNSRVLNREISR